MRYIVIAGTVLAIAAMSLPGCGRSKHRATMAEARPAAPAATAPASQDAYQQALSAWQTWQATEGCSGPERNAFIAAIGQLKADSANWMKKEADFPREARVARERHASMAFAFADEALGRGCYADAERMFQHLLEFYPGEAHASLQERAQFGMEDAQSARGLAEVKPD